MIEEQLAKINKYTRRELSANEVYIFSVILCDNEIDRDNECFSDDALNSLKELFIGKTGIFDHDAKSSMQTARIFDTELITDNLSTNKNGEPYKYLKASVYMVKTESNVSLIAEIDGGIKKEVSISCAASERVCSVCGCDKTKSSCSHINGKIYNGMLCHTILGGITDAYEWSFVAVPAQVNAGVTKHFGSNNNVCSEAVIADVAAADKELCRDIRRLAFFFGGKSCMDSALAAAEMMNTQQLISLKKSFEKKTECGGAIIQLESHDESENDNCSFYLR